MPNKVSAGPKNTGCSVRLAWGADGSGRRSEPIAGSTGRWRQVALAAALAALPLDCICGESQLLMTEIMAPRDGREVRRRPDHLYDTGQTQIFGTHPQTAQELIPARGRRQIGAIEDENSLSGRDRNAGHVDCGECADSRRRERETTDFEAFLGRAFFRECARRRRDDGILRGGQMHRTQFAQITATTDDRGHQDQRGDCFALRRRQCGQQRTESEPEQTDPLDSAGPLQLPQTAASTSCVQMEICSALGSRSSEFPVPT